MPVMEEWNIGMVEYWVLKGFNHFNFLFVQLTTDYCLIHIAASLQGHKLM